MHLDSFELMEFPEKRLFVYFYQQKFFAYSQRTHVLRFHFKSIKWAGNSVVPSLEVGKEAIAIRNISFRQQCGLLI